MSERSSWLPSSRASLIAVTAYQQQRDTFTVAGAEFGMRTVKSCAHRSDKPIAGQRDFARPTRPRSTEFVTCSRNDDTQAPRPDNLVHQEQRVLSAQSAGSNLPRVLTRRRPNRPIWQPREKLRGFSDHPTAQNLPAAFFGHAPIAGRQRPKSDPLADKWVPFRRQAGALVDGSY